MNELLRIVARRPESSIPIVSVPVNPNEQIKIFFTNRGEILIRGTAIPIIVGDDGVEIVIDLLR